MSKAKKSTASNEENTNRYVDYPEYRKAYTGSDRLIRINKDGSPVWGIGFKPPMGSFYNRLFTPLGAQCRDASSVKFGFKRSEFYGCSKTGFYMKWKITEKVTREMLLVLRDYLFELCGNEPIVTEYLSTNGQKYFKIELS